MSARILTAIISVFVLSLPSAHGARDCQSSFSQIAQTKKHRTASKHAAPIRIPTVRKLLDPKKLKEEGFALDEYDRLIDLRERSRVIGKVEVDASRYLYKWKPPKTQRALVRDGGLTPADMDKILDSKPLEYGKGYYISLDPVDSKQFGDGLTVFEAKGPMALLAFDPWLKYKSAAYYQRLRRAGIDAVRSDRHPTWLAIIDSKHLKTVKRSIQDPKWDNVNNLHKFLEVDKYLSMSRTWALFSEKSLFGRLLKKKVTREDRVELFDWLHQSGQVLKIFEEPATTPLRKALRWLYVTDPYWYDPRNMRDVTARWEREMTSAGIWKHLPKDSLFSRVFHGRITTEDVEQLAKMKEVRSFVHSNHEWSRIAANLKAAFEHAGLWNP